MVTYTAPNVGRERDEQIGTQNERYCVIGTVVSPSTSLKKSCGSIPAAVNVKVANKRRGISSVDIFLKD